MDINVTYIWSGDTALIFDARQENEKNGGISNK